MISGPDGFDRVALGDAGNQHAVPLPKLIRQPKRSLDILRNNMSASKKLV
jgi:hypothetical protein